jgi:anaerobic magnesium-protoporphyrin IX monomethyl ester cyclase
MKLLFINPPSKNNKQFVRLIDCSHEAKASYLWQPNDFMIISSYLSDSDEGFLLDGTCDQMSDQLFFKKLDEYKEADVDLIFFATGSACYYEDLEYFHSIRKLFFEKTICVLGDIFVEKNFREHILNNDADGIVYKPYNLELKEIIKIRQKKKNKENIEISCLITDPNNHPFFKELKKLTMIDSNVPRHELFKKGYSWPFLTTKNFTTLTTMWGCTYSCSYCTSGIMHPISRTNQSIINEIKYIKKLGFKEIQFFDKVFGIPKNDRKDLLRKIIDDGLSLPFSCYFHPSMYDPEFLDLMKKAGCHTIIIGIDSVDLESLAKYNRKVVEKTLNALIDHANKIKINICADFIIGLPHETEEDVMKTIDYSKKIKIDYASFNIAAPLPGSSFRKDAIADNKILDVDLADTLHTNYSSKFISSEKLMEIRRKANFDFYFRFSMIIRRLLRLKSFEHLKIQISQMIGIIKNNF